MEELENIETTSDEDYGTFTCKGSLRVDLNGQHWLKVQAGYMKPYDTSWYKLSGKPVRTLKEAFTSDAWVDTYSDQSERFTEDLGVKCELTDSPMW